MSRTTGFGLSGLFLCLMLLTSSIILIRQSAVMVEQEKDMAKADKYLDQTLHQVDTLIERLKKVESDNAKYREAFLAVGVDPDFVLTHKIVVPKEDAAEQPAQEEPKKQSYNKNGPWHMSLGRDL